MDGRVSGVAAVCRTACPNQRRVSTDRLQRNGEPARVSKHGLLYQTTRRDEHNHGLYQSGAMACDGRDSDGSVARRVAIEASAQCGVLGVPGEQCAMDRM